MRLNPNPSLFVRMALILLLGLLAAQAISLWLHWGERSTVVAQTRGQFFLDRVAEIVRLLEAEPAGRRAAAIRALQTGDLRITAIDAAQTFPHAPRGQIAALGARLGSEREIRMPGGMGMGGMSGGRGMASSGMGGSRGMGMSGSSTRAVDVRLADGQWLRIAASPESEAPPALPPDFLIHLFASLLIVLAVVIFAVRLATRPLKELAGAADAFGRDLEALPLAETGPRETRQAAQAFNRMRQRIRRLVDERSRALAAVSHDLRTPLTRLRLRAELVDDARLREQINADLEAMTAMIDATLDYFRGLREDENIQLIDIDALLQSLAEDATVLGRRIGLDGTAIAPYPGRLHALRRALQNLIDNAFRYGGGAGLRIEDDGDALRLSVEDDGPGIPPAEIARVTEPYYRSDASRGRASGGVGLGLTIASDVARRHGGALRLHNRSQGGLTAMLILPRRKQAG